MYVFSRKARVYHHEGCRHARRILPENRLELASEAAAMDKALVMCRCCGAIHRNCRDVLSQLQSFCENNRVRCEVSDRAVWLKTSRCWWKLMLRRSGGFLLFHENTEGIGYARDVTPFWRREYHVQNYSCGSLMKYAQYTVQHDKWRNGVENPHTKKQKADARREAARKRSGQISRVLALIDTVAASVRTAN